MRWDNVEETLRPTNIKDLVNSVLSTTLFDVWGDDVNLGSGSDYK